MDSEPLKFEYNANTDVIVIEGVKYSGGLFRTLGIAPPGTQIEIVAREDGVLTVRRLFDDHTSQHYRR